MISKVYHCALEVRGHELDSFGHVNNAVYLSYLEHARWKLLEEENIRLAQFNEWKRWPIIARVEVDYLKPTFMGDALDVRSKVVEASRTSFLVEQGIYRGETQVLRAKVKVVMVNENGRPAELPASVSRMWET